MMPKPNALWTETELRRLRALWAAGVRGDGILDRFPNRSRGAIKTKRSELGLKDPRTKNGRKPYVPKGRPGARWSPSEDQRFALLWRQGIALKRMTEELGKSEGALNHRRTVLGLAPRRKGDRPVEVTVRVEPDLHRKAGQRAMARGLSLSTYVRSLMLRDV
jgi:hypothetical protein